MVSKSIVYFYCWLAINSLDCFRNIVETLFRDYVLIWRFEMIVTKRVCVCTAMDSSIVTFPYNWRTNYFEAGECVRVA